MGRPEFSAPGTRGGGQKIATNNRPEMRGPNTDESTDVAAGSSETVEFYAPSGSVYNAYAMDVWVSGISGAGGSNHQFLIYTQNDMKMLQGMSSPTTQVKFRYGVWDRADTNQWPASAEVQTAQLRRLKATENDPIKITYENNTDNTQSNARHYDVVAEEVTY